MSFPLVVGLLAVLLGVPTQMMGLWREMANWHAKQIALDNAAIRLGRRDSQWRTSWKK